MIPVSNDPCVLADFSASPATRRTSVGSRECAAPVCRVEKGAFASGAAKGAQRKSVVLAWSLLILGGTFLLLGFFTLSWLRSQMRTKQVVQHVAEEKKAKIESKFPSPSQEEAVSLVKNALAARDPVNVLAYFRTGNSEIPEIIQFLAALPSKMGEIQNIQWLSSLDANDLLLEGLMIISELDGERLNRLVLLTPDEEGTWKVDYESFARKVDPSWDQLISGEA
ncbi:MAG: hypothetical protein ACO3RV_04190, partial [Luteolibacter sp.]